jgi:hypothetical protein
MYLHVFSLYVCERLSICIVHAAHMNAKSCARSATLCTMTKCYLIVSDWTLRGTFTEAQRSSSKPLLYFCRLGWYGILGVLCVPRVGKVWQERNHGKFCVNIV